MSLPSKTAGSPKAFPTSKYFLHCLPIKWLRIVILPSMSRAMKVADIAPLTYGDLICNLGLWLLICTCYGWKREEFWSVAPFDQEANRCPYRLGEFMSKRCFNAINRELRFTNTNPPPYVDQFWKKIQMVKAWNDHMTYIFLASWAICLYEYMSIWHCIWICPGWIFCPQRPHPFGNKCHTAFYVLSGILFVVELI